MTLEEYREQYRKDLRHEVDKLSNEYEAQLKAKDEEIHYLKTQMTGYSMMFDEPQDAKARSIVAMLFWEWRRCIRECTEADIPYDLVDDSYALCVVKEEIFEKAYKMLKDTK